MSHVPIRYVVEKDCKEKDSRSKCRCLRNCDYFVKSRVQVRISVKSPEPINDHGEEGQCHYRSPEVRYSDYLKETTSNTDVVVESIGKSKRQKV